MKARLNYSNVVTSVWLNAGTFEMEGLCSTLSACVFDSTEEQRLAP